MVYCIYKNKPRKAGQPTHCGAGYAGVFGKAVFERVVL